MAASMLNRFCVAIQRLETAIAHVLQRGFPPGAAASGDDALCLAALGTGRAAAAPDAGRPFSLGDIIGDGFLWAVPKHRRSLEKKHKRKYGYPERGVLKLILPKSNLQVCNVCGDDHEIGLLCPTCYKRVEEETKLMKDKIQAELGLEPVDKEVIVLYEGEKEQKPPEFWEGKRIIEMNKPRPEWFSQNLLQQTTQPLATTKDVKPSKLG